MQKAAQAAEMEVDANGAGEPARDAVPLVPSPPPTSPSVTTIRDTHCSQLIVGTEWIHEEMEQMGDAIANGQMAGQSLEELVAVQDEWKEIRARMVRATASIDECMTELKTVMTIKHRRLKR